MNEQIEFIELIVGLLQCSYMIYISAVAAESSKLELINFLLTKIN